MGYSLLNKIIKKEIIPSGKIIKSGKQLDQYFAWKITNKYKGKRFSIFGDSISTLEGYNPKGYFVFFQGDTCKQSGVNTMSDTWWGKVIDFFGGELLVNNSWSGCQVTRMPYKDKDFPSGISDERTSGLHVNSIQPDVIIIYMGINDWANGVTPCYTDFLGDEITPRWYSFEDSYFMMLQKIRANYKNAKIFCCTLNPTYMSSNPSFSFPSSPAGISIEVYNDYIKTNCKLFGCQLIDLYNNNIPYDSIDGTHPTAVGMSTLAKMVISGIDIEAGNQFLDYTNELSTLTMGPMTKNLIDLNPTNTDGECINEHEIQLLQTNTGKNIVIKKTMIHVGRDTDCDLYIENKYVGRHHASFVFNGSKWLLIDHDSTNGTWLNETKLMPEEKYVLHSNDKIHFANSEVYVFYKTQKSNLPSD